MVSPSYFHSDLSCLFQLSQPRKFSVTNLSSFNWCVETKLHTSVNSRKVKLKLQLCYLYYMFFLFQNYFVAAIFSITPPTIPSFEMEEETWKNFLKYVHYVSLTMSVLKNCFFLQINLFVTLEEIFEVGTNCIKRTISVFKKILRISHIQQSDKVKVLTLLWP